MQTITEPENRVLSLMEKCLRGFELPSQPPENKAAAAKMRDYLKNYPNRQPRRRKEVA